MSADYRVYPNPQAAPGAGAYGQAGQATHPGMAPQYPGYGAYPAPGQGYYYGYGAPAQSPSLLNDRFLKGLVIGAAATYLLTNDSVQHAAIKTAVKAWSMMQGGVEELKERFKDAEAELRVAEAAGDE